MSSTIVLLVVIAMAQGVIIALLMHTIRRLDYLIKRDTSPSNIEYNYESISDITRSINWDIPNKDRLKQAATYHELSPEQHDLGQRIEDEFAQLAKEIGKARNPIT